MEEECKLLQLDEHGVICTNKIIGRGAYGCVKEVFTLSAAKEVHSALLVNCSQDGLEKLKKNFLQECVQCSQLYHPNIVQFLGIHYPSKYVKLPWLVMEKMDCSLSQYLEQYKKDEVSFQAKMSILHDVSHGLQYLHVQDIIHRDLSSNNILLTNQLVAKIGDLGVAKVIDTFHTEKDTRVPGTPHFMPPEALSVNPTYGKPVDVFSLGCVMIHTVTHVWPTPKDETHVDKTTGKKLVRSEIERRDEYLALIKRGQLLDCIKQCLHNSPIHRPSISNVSMILRELQPDLKLSKSQFILFDLQQERDFLTQSCEKLSKEVERLMLVDRELKEANITIDNLEKHVQELQQKLGKYEEEGEQRKRRSSFFKRDVKKQHSAEVDKYRDLKTAQELASGKAKEKDELVKQLEDDKKNLTAQLEASTQETDNLKQTLESDHQQVVKQLNEKEEKIRELESSFKDHRSEIEKMEARLKEIQISRTDEKKNKETLQQMPPENMQRIVAKLEEKLKQREDEMKQMGTTIQELSTVNQSIGKKLKDTVKQMETGYKEREDRIAELEEFINDQVTELDKMEAALKQTVANKETLEKEFNELNEEMNRRYLQASAAEQVSADKDAKMQQMEKKVQRVFDEKAKVQEELNTTKEHLIFYKKEVQRLSEIQFNQQHPPPPVRSEQPSYGQAEHYVSEGINEEIRHQADFQRQQNQQDLEFTSHLAPDPFLICPNCKRQFREGQLPEYRRHIDNCRL